MPSIPSTFQLIICSSKVLLLYNCHSTYHLICCTGLGQPQGCTSNCQSLQLTVRAIQRTNHATPKMSLGATCRNANAQTAQNSDKDTATFKGREESFFGGQRSLMTVVITSAGSLPRWGPLTSRSGHGPCLRQAQPFFGGKW